jgi:hypothetical protein
MSNKKFDATYDLILRQGTTEILRVGPWTDDDGTVASFTGFKARCSARRGFGASPAFWTRDTDDGNITFEDDGTDVDAVIVIQWDSDETTVYDNPGKGARWDLEIYDDGVSPEVVDRVLEGSYDLSLEVTE